ncbi:hypothetical protein ABT116_46425, partial [Streptomyces sp. NPDC002130]|uniref:hypothetical protein n=1 Tax=Streptomyces sp. NPDC002130 TaxID=3155568 RepID=UPI003330A640
TRPGAIRPRLTSFVGREPEIDAIRSDMHSSVLIAAVFKLSFNAATDDSEVTSSQNCDHCTVASIAAKGAMTNAPPISAGR